MCWVTLSPKGRVSWWLGSTFWESRGVRGLAGSSLRAGILSFLLWSNGQPKSRVGNRLISSEWEVCKVTVQRSWMWGGESGAIFVTDQRQFMCPARPAGCL